MYKLYTLRKPQSVKGSVGLRIKAKKKTYSVLQFL